MAGEQRGSRRRRVRPRHAPRISLPAGPASAPPGTSTPSATLLSSSARWSWSPRSVLSRLRRGASARRDSRRGRVRLRAGPASCPRRAAAGAAPGAAEGRALAGGVGEQLAHRHKLVALALQSLDELGQRVRGAAPGQAVVEQDDRPRSDVVEHVAGDLLGADPLPRRDSVLGVDAPQDHAHPLLDRRLGHGPVDGAEGGAEEASAWRRSTCSIRAVQAATSSRWGTRSARRSGCRSAWPPLRIRSIRSWCPSNLRPTRKKVRARAVALQRVEDSVGLEDRAVVEGQGDLAIAPAGGAAALVDQPPEVREVASLAVLRDEGREDVAAPSLLGARRRRPVRGAGGRLPGAGSRQPGLCAVAGCRREWRVAAARSGVVDRIAELAQLVAHDALEGRRLLVGHVLAPRARGGGAEELLRPLLLGGDRLEGVCLDRSLEPALALGQAQPFDQRAERSRRARPAGPRTGPSFAARPDGRRAPARSRPRRPTQVRARRRMNSWRSSGVLHPRTGSQPPGWLAAVCESTTSRPSRTRNTSFERGNIDITRGAAWAPATSLRSTSGEFTS